MFQKRPKKCDPEKETKKEMKKETQKRNETEKREKQIQIFSKENR